MTELRVVAVLALASACTSAPIDEAGVDGAVLDGGLDTAVVDVPAIDAPMTACPLGEGAQGHRIDQVLPPLLLSDCEGVHVPLHDDAFCDASTRLTIVNVAAGWCVPCQEESAHLTAELTEPFRAEGVRVIQILVEDPRHGQPTPAFCDEWVAAYGLTNDMRIDPDRRAGVLWPDGILPATYIIDREGTVRYRQNATEGIDGIVRAIQALLAEDAP